MEEKKENENSCQVSSRESKLSRVYESSFDKCMSLMKTGEWALLETWLRNLNKIDFDVNTVDKVIFYYMEAHISFKTFIF